MHYIFEAIFVGIYSGVIAIILSFVLHNYYYLLFLTGFIKHVGGYYLNIHTYYCNHGDACTKTHSIASSNNVLISKLLRLTPTEFNHSPSTWSTARSKNKPVQLLFESIIEGIAYVVGGFICSFFISNMYVSVFIIGIAMHILAELVGIHRFFCKNRCVKLI
jgi:hypothetical protein